MKKKLTRILGVALPLAMVLALAVTLLPASAPTAEADVGTLKFEPIPLLKFGSAGRYVLASDTDLGVIAVSSGGSVMFASANTTSGVSANVSSLLRSSDGGYSWTTLHDNFSAGQSTIVDIEISPEYSSDTTVIVATEDYVWTSVDGGTIFTGISPTGWDTDETITDMDVIIDEGGRLATIIGSSETTGEGDVWVQCPATTGSWWEAQEVGRDVLAVAFSPNFASDECIMAVTVNTTHTIMTVAFGSTRDGGGWGDSIGDADFRDGLNPISTATRARIAFPDDYDVDSLTSNIAFVGLTASTAVGDVFKVILETGTTSAAIDMNVRGLVGLNPTASNIWSIDASGNADAEAANIIVGLAAWTTATTPDTWLAYYSTDSGENWYSARTKSPTGGDPAWTNNLLESGTGAECNVLMSPNFATSGVAYAVTKGAETSALSRTADGGKSWNQISLIDYSNTTDYYAVADFDPNLMFGSTPTAYLTLQSGGGRGSVWKTTNGGGTWERILSYANPSVTDSISGFSPVGGDTVFAKDYTNGKLWRSPDGGATFPRVITAKSGMGALTVCNPIDETTIHTADANGAIWTTTSLGRPWVDPEESDTDGYNILDISPRGDIWLVPTTSGKVFISTDGGVTITDTVGVTDLVAAYGRVTRPFFDPGYDTNHFVYASTPWGGIWRIELNEADPDSTFWKRIDGDTPNAAAGAPYVGAYAAHGMVGPTLYCWDYSTVNTTATPPQGGLWRCVNPAANIDGLYPPLFEKTQAGLSHLMSMQYAGYAVYPNTVFMKDVSVAGTSSCHNQLYAFGDVLSSPVSLVLPDDGATDVGVRLETIDLTMEVLAGWESMPSALSYEYQLALDEEFLSPLASPWSRSGRQSQQARWENLPLGWTYYWRVRADSPLLSPWSEGRNFTVGTVEPTVGVVFDIISPERGASDVPIQPTFVWAEVEGATSYELVVAEDPTFAIIDWSRTSANPFFKAEESLAYDTTYAWRVRAADGEWATGVFTTEAEPVEPVEPVVIEPTAPAEIKIVEVPAAAPIPTYLLWTIIGVGAVLFIALIILIVRTRRVT